MSSANYTTISLTPQQRDALRGMKRGQESYSELIGRLFKNMDQEGDS